MRDAHVARSGELQPGVAGTETLQFTDAIFAAANTIAEANGLSPNLLITKQVCRKIAAWNCQGLAIDFTFMSSWRQTLLKDIILELAEEYK